MIEKHYTINDLAGLLSMSLERTRQMIKDEPGVLRFEPERKKGKSATDDVPNPGERGSAHLEAERKSGYDACL